MEDTTQGGGDVERMYPDIHMYLSGASIITIYPMFICLYNVLMPAQFDSRFTHTALLLCNSHQRSLIAIYTYHMLGYEIK